MFSSILIISTASVMAAPAIPVNTVEGLRAAIEEAGPGDLITLAPGAYRLDEPLDLKSSGRSDQPIVLAAMDVGSAYLEVNTPEGLRVSGAHWTISGLDLEGVCSDDSTCEHAIHLGINKRSC